MPRANWICAAVLKQIVLPNPSDRVLETVRADRLDQIIEGSFSKGALDETRSGVRS